MTPLAAYLLLFTAVGVGFIFVHLLLGRLIRPDRPQAEKSTVYECGEPTIGSAWVQFDLRFYVIALLFVIFDVEVAFLFPWAEVFGKANAIVNAPPPDSAAAYNEIAARILDLSVPEPAGEVAGVRKRSRDEVWKQLRQLTPAQLAGFRQLSREQVGWLRMMSAAGFAAAVELTPEQTALLRRQATALDATIRTIRQELDAAIPGLIKELRPQAAKLEALARTGAAPGQAVAFTLFVESLPRDPSLVESNLRAAILGDLVRQNPANVHLLLAQPPWQKAVAAAAPAQARALDALARGHQERLRKQVNALLVELNRAGPGQKVLWEQVNSGGLVLLGSLTPEQLAALPLLSPATLAVLVGPLVEDTRQAAATLAWLALGEVLFFFGVLLVGYAYLWRRGDLTWVRSLAAEYPAGPAMPAARIESVGAGGQS